MTRPILSSLLALPFLASCDKLADAAAEASRRGSLEDQIRVSSAAKPEIVAAFEAVRLANLEHNRKFLELADGDGAVNEPAHNAGLAVLERAAREQRGLGKMIIDAVLASRTHEKSLFIPFDTCRRQIAGMNTWTPHENLQRRGYIQIIDQQMVIYDEGIAYLERGEEPLLLQNFKRHGVPDDVAGEFLRLKREGWKEAGTHEREMFREQRAALQSYRDGMTTANPAQANAHLAEARRHEQNASQAESKLLAEVRKFIAAADSR